MYLWNKKRVLVTGAGGFIGSHLVEQLVVRGASVRAFVRYNSRADPGLLRMLSSDTQGQVKLIAGDLRDTHAIRRAIEGCQIVFHLGALISIPYSYYHPVEVAETNLVGTLNVLMGCQDSDVERLIHTSSSEVYGTARQVPIDESHPLQGQSPYSASKIGADKLAESFYCAYDMPVVTIRPFNTFGPRQSARAVIPTIITQALTRRTIRLGNLETSRDFTYISDTVEGLLLAAEVNGIEGQTFNLGTGKEISIRDLAQMIIEKVGRNVKITKDPLRLRPEKSEVQRLISNNSMAQQHLGWTPRISFEQGLELTIEWIKDHINLYRAGQYEF
jgi:NAD dependent epimerase/dehydratase